MVDVDVFLEFAGRRADYGTVLARWRMYKFRMGLKIKITRETDKTIAWRLIVIASIKLLRTQ